MQMKVFKPTAYIIGTFAHSSGRLRTNILYQTPFGYR